MAITKSSEYKTLIHNVIFKSVLQINSPDYNHKRPFESLDLVVAWKDCQQLRTQRLRQDAIFKALKRDFKVKHKNYSENLNKFVEVAANDDSKHWYCQLECYYKEGQQEKANTELIYLGQIKLADVELIKAFVEARRQFESELPQGAVVEREQWKIAVGSAPSDSQDAHLEQLFATVA